MIAPLGHNFSGEYTGDESGHWHVCSRCGAKETAPHAWDAGKVTKGPTASAEGERTYTCTVCGVTRTESIPTEYLFIDATDYRVVQDDVSGGGYYSYRAWHEDGTSPAGFYVKDVDNEYLGAPIGQADLIKYSGLYTINANNEITGEIPSQNGSSPRAHDEVTAAEPYAHV